MLGLTGEKLGMTQIYNKDGSVVPVTVVRVSPNVVTSVKTADRHGYNAVQMAHHEQKEHRMNKAQLGLFKKVKVAAHNHLKEFRTDRAPEYTIGMKITAAAFVAGDQIDVQAESKGRGFQGVMKRHGFGGGPDSHGNSVSHRVPGSVGQNTYPARVIPGKKMPGHMGSERITTKNLEVVATEPEQNLILVKGAVPGGKNGRVYLYPHSADFETKILAAKQPKGSEKEEV